MSLFWHCIFIFVTVYYWRFLACNERFIFYFLFKKKTVLNFKNEIRKCTPFNKKIIYCPESPFLKNLLQSSDILCRSMHVYQIFFFFFFLITNLYAATYQKRNCVQWQLAFSGARVQVENHRWNINAARICSHRRGPPRGSWWFDA